MLATAVTLLLASSNFSGSDTQVAFVARFYAPPTSNRKSDHHVYVSRLDGTKRRQISKVGGYREIRWIDANTLAWVDENVRLEIFDLKQGRVIAKRTLPEASSFFESRERAKVRPWGNDDVLDSLGKLKKDPLAAVKSLWESGSMRLDNGKAISWEASDAFDEKFRYTFDEKHLMCSISGNPGNLFRGKNGCAYLMTWSGGASAGSTEWVYSFDPTNAKLRPIISNIDRIDFDPNSRYWAGLQPGRPLVPYGKSRHVWANDIWVGDVKTGKRWRIAKGLVHGSGAAIRPGL